MSDPSLPARNRPADALQVGPDLRWTLQQPTAMVRRCQILRSGQAALRWARQEPQNLATA
eukprot:8998723-Pyramimonas_sp.AAC.1